MIKLTKYEFGLGIFGVVAIIVIANIIVYLQSQKISDLEWKLQINEMQRGNLERDKQSLQLQVGDLNIKLDEALKGGE